MALIKGGAFCPPAGEQNHKLVGSASEKYNNLKALFVFATLFALYLMAGAVMDLIPVLRLPS